MIICFPSAQLSGKDKEHQDEIEALKNKHQEEIFDLKQQNHYLSAKVGPYCYTCIQTAEITLKSLDNCEKLLRGI